MNKINYYKISELSEITSVPMPTIRFYLKEGLLPPAIKATQTSAYYTDEHLNRLTFIKKMKDEEHMSLSNIKKELNKIPIEKIKHPKGTIASSSNKRKIINVAIDLFIQNGVGETSIDDVVNLAQVGKGTFYKYFSDKNELFAACADTVFYEMYSYIWEEIRQETDMLKRLLKRFEAFLNSYDRWIDMMNLLRYCSVGNNPFFKQKYHEILDQITTPISHDLEILKKENQIDKNVDCKGLAYLLLGITEYGVSVIKNEYCTIDDFKKSLNKVLLDGILKPDSSFKTISTKSASKKRKTES